MANKRYAKGRQGFLEGKISWTDDDIKVVLIDTSFYTADIDEDQFLSDIPAEARVATSNNLQSKTATNGVADAANVSLLNQGGASAEAIVIYQDTGVESTSRLIAYIDSATGLPLEPDNTDISITWDDGTYKIFEI